MMRGYFMTGPAALLLFFSSLLLGAAGDALLFWLPVVALLSGMGLVVTLIWPFRERAIGGATLVTAATGLLVLMWRWSDHSAAAVPGVALTLTLLGLIVLMVGGAWSLLRPWRALTPTYRPRPASPAPATAAPSMPTIVDVEFTAAPDRPPPAPAATAVDQTELLDDQPDVLAWLIIRDGQQAGSQYRLFTQTTIGRNPGNDIVSGDSAMSAYHARVVWQNGRFVMVDLGSTNGIYFKDEAAYNWQRADRVILEAGTQVKLGRTIYHMMIVVPE